MPVPPRVSASCSWICGRFLGGGQIRARPCDERRSGRRLQTGGWSSDLFKLYENTVQDQDSAFASIAFGMLGLEGTNPEREANVVRGNRYSCRFVSFVVPT
jgi:hypothetical protein